ncbi:hypothetical protein [Ponticaulis sp.]|uniref:hypothetical protein n=1 Tax=Ponticaulis sp. TaxID=2020902 RepID=UPI000C5E0BDC|nr:hypothetical protein [Ponticaulis sp.]MBN05885.1 hypothetical protein [Ponticaulis sp.]|tara:strand:- start:549 stop:1340 length:792 start_codon:yes stop_codon:yes gene_type:complete
MKKICLAGVASLSLLGIPALADEVDPLADIYACANIADDSARLACFDTAVSATQSAQQAGDFRTITRQDSERVQEDAFGLRIPSISNFNILSPGSRPNALADAVPEPEPTPEPVVEAPTQVAEAPETPEPAEPVAAAPEVPETVETPAQPIAPPVQAAPTPTPAPAAPEEEAEDENRPLEVERNDDGEIESVSLSIERITVNANDQITVYFRNGQVWRQIESRPTRLNRRRPPTFATIRRTTLGAYVMRLNGQGQSLLVRRVD